MQLGLSNNSAVNSRILTIVEGSFRLKVSSDVQGAVKRINKKGDEVYESVFSNLNGYIKDISFEDTEYGKKVNILIDADKEYRLSLGYADSLVVNLYKILPNINPAYPVNLNLVRKPDDKGTMRTSLFVNQKGLPCKWAYTKANPNGMPSMEQITVKGNLVWDNTKQVDFLVVNSLTPFIEKLKTVKREEIIPEIEIPVETVVYEGDLNTPAKGYNMDGSISDEDIPF